MTTTAAALLVAALALSALDWYAVATGRRRLEYACKPAAAVGFLAASLALDPASSTARAWFCVALLACAVGDVCLMLPRDLFLAGLSAFAGAQVCFAAGFVAQGIDRARLAFGIVAVAAVAIPLLVRFVRALRASGSRSLVGPVVGYVLVIATMVACAIGAGPGWGVAGALLFLLSDALIGETRFVAARRWAPVAIIVTYHLALAGLVVSVA